MCEATELSGSADMISSWNKVLESSNISDKLLLPFQEWNIDFSELTVGTRVGIGKELDRLSLLSLNCKLVTRYESTLSM